MSTPLPVPDFRFRRLRRTANLRGMVRETRLSATDLILPIFVEEGISAPVPIASMPGVVRHTEAGLGDAVAWLLSWTPAVQLQRRGCKACKQRQTAMNAAVPFQPSAHQRKCGSCAQARPRD